MQPQAILTAVVRNIKRATRYKINPWEEVLIKVSSEETNNAYCVIEHLGAPESAPPLHLHREADEIFEVLEGRVGFWIDGKAFEATPGTTVSIPKKMPHTWRNLGKTHSRMVVTFVPGGTDGFFEAVEGILHSDPRAAQLATKFDSIYLGPPIEPEAWEQATLDGPE